MAKEYIMQRPSLHNSQERPSLPQTPPNGDLKAPDTTIVCSKAEILHCEFVLNLFCKLIAAYCPNVSFPGALMESRLKK